MANNTQKNGFTLIELSMVLVIIGLLVGGVLTGQELISGARTQVQITQIQKYHSSVNTFKVKYGYLPGDLPSSAAASFGFNPRGPYPGQGDGNGLIEGSYGEGQGDNMGIYEGGGETLLFWTDLSAARLIDGSFTAGVNCCMGQILQSTVANFFPAARIGNGNYIYVYSGGTETSQWNSTGINYFAISALTTFTSQNDVISNPNLTVAQAYNIDKKIDDGLPQSGSVLALYLNNGGGSDLFWAGNTNNNGVAFTTSTPGTTSSCFDNGSGSGTQQYSMGQNKGANQTCALSFKFQ